MFDIEVAVRQGSLPTNNWRELRAAIHPAVQFDGCGDGELPDELLRLGVRYGDGTKVTTVRAPFRHGIPPTPPVLIWSPVGSGGRGHLGPHFSHFGLWLWPLPPAEHLDFAVEWPAAGVELTFTELDAAPIVAAADRSPDYWPA